MKLTIEIPDKLVDNPLGYIDIRLHKDGVHINKITMATGENPYFTFLQFDAKEEYEE